MKTDEISLALGRGKHTTREVSLMPAGKGWIADTPGFGILEFEGMDEIDISHSFVEFLNLAIIANLKDAFMKKNQGVQLKPL